LGDALAKIVDDEHHVLSLIELLKNEKKDLAFIQSFIFRKVINNGLPWAFTLFKKLKSMNFGDQVLAQIFIPINPSKELWTFIDNTTDELKKEYWLSVYPHLYHLSKEEKIIGLDYLLSYNKFFAAINNSYLFPEELPSELIARILKRAATEKANDEVRSSAYEIEVLFGALDGRNDIDREILIELEWLYLPILASYGAGRSPKLLHDELAKSPEFFVAVLKWVYQPKNPETVENEQKGISTDAIKNRAEQAFKLLHSWKTIPGVDIDGNIDEQFLNTWIDESRRSAENASRLEVADAQIGQVLAQFPEKNMHWPPDEICKVLERINTDSIKRNFSSATFNKRGSSSRGAFDGGNIERNHAEYFQKLAEDRRSKYPNVANILTSLANGYLADAQRMDEEAAREKLEY
jgi:hypothetical protein